MYYRLAGIHCCQSAPSTSPLQVDCETSASKLDHNFQPGLQFDSLLKNTCSTHFMNAVQLKLKYFVIVEEDISFSRTWSIVTTGHEQCRISSVIFNTVNIQIVIFGIQIFSSLKQVCHFHYRSPTHLKIFENNDPISKTLPSGTLSDGPLLTIHEVHS